MTASKVEHFDSSYFSRTSLGKTAQPRAYIGVAALFTKVRARCGVSSRWRMALKGLDTRHLGQTDLLEATSIISITTDNEKVSSRTSSSVWNGATVAEFKLNMAPNQTVTNKADKYHRTMIVLFCCISLFLPPCSHLFSLFLSLQLEFMELVRLPKFIQPFLHHSSSIRNFGVRNSS